MYAGDVSVGDPHLGAVQHIELVVFRAVALADQRHVVDIDAPIADHEVAILLFALLVGVLLRDDLGRLHVIAVAVEDPGAVELEPTHVDDVTPAVLVLLVQIEVLHAVGIGVDTAANPVAPACGCVPCRIRRSARSA